MKKSKKVVRKATKKIWYAWLSNTTDHDDDEPLKILAYDYEHAHRIAGHHLSNRFLISGVYTSKDFGKYYPGWKRLIGDHPVTD